MSEKEKKDSFLLQCFQEFYAQLEEMKKRACTGTWTFKDGASEADVSKSGKDSTEPSNYVYQKMGSLFERQQLEAGKSGNKIETRLYDDALFVMSAITDEIFLTMSWAGQEAWSKFLLETKFFGSNAGGDIFFLKLESLLKERDPVYAELATLFLLALSLGFRGKYHGINDAGVLDHYKNQLYAFIFQKSPDLNVIDRKLFAGAYMHTLEQESKTTIPGLKKWYGFVALLVLTLLGVSHIMWIQMTGEIAKTAAQILGS